MSFNLLDATAEVTEEHCHKTRRTLMSPQECKIARCTPNQLEMKPISPSLAPYLSHVPHHREQVSWLPLGNYRDSLRHLSQVYMDINFFRATRRKLHAHHIVSRWELIPCLWLKRWANFPQALQEEFSLSNRYVRETLLFSLSSGMDPERPWLKRRPHFPAVA